MSQSKNRKMTWLCILALAGIAAGILSWTDMETKGRHYVAVVVKSTESAFWKSVFAGANAAGTEYNINLSVDGPDTEEDYETQNLMIEKAVRDGAEVIIFSAVDYSANAQAITEAAKQGVGIVVIDSDVDSDAVSCRIGTDNYEAGVMAGTAALTSSERELHIGIVNYDVHSANGQQREAGFRDRVFTDERVKSVTTINVLSETEAARAETVRLLEKHPEINVVATFNEWTSLGVGWAIRDLGLSDKTTVVAFDSNVVSVGMLETGEVDALIVQNPYAMGYLGVEKAYQLIEGHKVDSNQMDTETIIVTRENMFLPEYQKMLFPFD